MHLALVGMSNIGKSHWARRLAAEGGFAHVDCDALVEARLGDELTRLGYAGLRDVARWMGQPYEPRYPEASAKYVACEQAVMEESLERLWVAHGTPLVIDTTGSVVYVAPGVLAALRERTRVIYLEEPHGHVEALFVKYIAEPKPVIWGASFMPHAGEFPEESLRRCYRELLRERATRYRALAHVVIPYAQHSDPAASIRLLTEA